jgi:cysteine desulfuration protein SufE
MSQVWFVRDDEGDQRLHWRGDSDAAIVRGLIAVLQVLYAGKTADEIRAIDVEGVFRSLGLERHLTINRRNGFFAMVSRLRDLAGEMGAVA